MHITDYLYNTFPIQQGNLKIAIDPGGLFLYYLRLTTLIPQSEWEGITYILITHGDPDHYWHADRVAAASGAAVVRNETMVQKVEGKSLMDEDEVLEAVNTMQPVMVVPCNYNCPGFFTKHYNPADAQYFKSEVEKLDSKCVILGNGESVEL